MAAKAKLKPNTPVWLDTAKKYIGVKEYPGRPSNPTILKWAQKLGRLTGLNYTGDDIPWCGLFTSFVLNENGILPVSLPLRALSWAKWGQELKEGAPGAVLVFTRNGGGHVGFYISEDDKYFHVLGGNQSDSVNVTKIAKSRLASIRWPAGYALPTCGPVCKKFDGKVSTNEA